MPTYNMLTQQKSDSKWMWDIILGNSLPYSEAEFLTDAISETAQNEKGFFSSG